MRLTKNQLKNYNKYYIVYRIVDLSNRKSYIGAHKIRHQNENDGYICSSKLVLALYYKNPKNFKKLILARFSTAREADRFEKKSIKKYDSFKNGYNRTKDGGPYRAGRNVKRIGNNYFVLKKRKWVNYMK